MERITNLKREIKVGTNRKSLTKLKLNLSKRRDATLEKIAMYFAKDLTEDMLNGDPNEYMKFKNIPIEVHEWEYDIKLKRFVKDDYGSENKAYRIEIFDRSEMAMDAFTVPAIAIPTKNRKYEFFYPERRDASRILDMRYIYGVLKMLDTVYEFINENPYILEKDFEDVSYYGNSYSKDIQNGLLDFINLTEFTLYKIRGLSEVQGEMIYYVQSLVIDTILLMQTVDSNIELMDKYNSDTRSECARAFETKKNIPLKVQKVMNNNIFLKDFKYVEIDSETDLMKFRLIEKEWKRMKNALNLEENFKDSPAELRFRKLGKHRSGGLYYYSLRCICVDLSSPQSFLHELGHYIDYTNKEGQLSMEYAFIPLLNEYKKAYNKYLIKKDADSVNIAYLKRKINYYFSPTEVFARLFELYLSYKGFETSFLKDKEDFIMLRGYPEISEQFKELIIKYFDDTLNINLDLIEKDEPQKAIINELLNTEYVSPVETNNGQFSFAI